MTHATILLVEDRDEDAELTVRAFRRARLENEIVVKCDGYEALEYLETSSPPAMVLVDINMPRMNGIRLLERIRQIDRLRSVPVIMLTSSLEERDLIACYDRGASSYLRKPVARADFAELIAHLGLHWMVLNKRPA